MTAARVASPSDLPTPGTPGAASVAGATGGAGRVAPPVGPAASPPAPRWRLRADDLPATAWIATMSALAGLNVIRIGTVGIGVFAEAALVAAALAALALAALLRLRLRLPRAALAAAATWFALAAWAVVRGDATLGASIAISTGSWLLLRRRVADRRVLVRGVYVAPLGVAFAFQALYVAMPSLVFEAEAGGKFVAIAGLTWMRFEGATLNANAWGLYAAVVLFGLREAGVRGPLLWPGGLSLLASLSYSSIAGFLFLVFVRRAGAGARIGILAVLAAMLAAYSLVKGWGLAESVRLIKYGWYAAALLDAPPGGLLAGGLDRATHDWVVLTDNAWLTLTYDHGLLFLAAYAAAYAVVLRRDPALLALFAMANAVVDLQFFWMANLAFLLVAERRGTLRAADAGAR